MDGLLTLRALGRKLSWKIWQLTSYRFLSDCLGIVVQFNKDVPEMFLYSLVEESHMNCRKTADFVEPFAVGDIQGGENISLNATHDGEHSLPNSWMSIVA